MSDREEQAVAVDRPVVLLLHRFPTSSWQFRNLIPTLADRYRAIAPDFAGYADLTEGLIDQLGVDRYALYAFDYGTHVALYPQFQQFFRDKQPESGVPSVTSAWHRSI